MPIGTIFKANLNADKIYIDMAYLSDPIKYSFWLTVKNQSLSGLYFKLICNIPNWSLESPADGKLGGIGGGVTNTFIITIVRNKPETEVVDEGNLKIEAYTDSNYTNKISEDSLSVTVYIEDLESWSDVDISDFDDGTTQGWTLASDMTISNDQSVEAGGYSARFFRNQKFDQEASLTKTISLPNRNKVRLSFFLAYRIRTPDINYKAMIYNLSVYVDDVKVFDIPFTIDWVRNEERIVGWLKFATDLSEYKGQTKTIKISCMCKAEMPTNLFSYVYLWYDNVVIAGKD